MAGDIFKTKHDIKNAEEMSENIRTVRPGIWIILIAVFVFLAGMFVFFALGSYDSTVTVAAYAENGKTWYFVKASDAYIVKAGMKVIYEDCDNIDTICGYDADAEYIEAAYVGDYIMQIGNYEDGDKGYMYFSKSNVEDGVHEADIIVEELNLMDFFFN